MLKSHFSPWYEFLFQPDTIWLRTLSFFSLWKFSAEFGLGCRWTACSSQGGVGRGMDSCRLSVVVCRKEYILHVTRKGNRYGSVSQPSVTEASHVDTDKGEPGRRDGNKAPVCYCPSGLWVNVGPLIRAHRPLQWCSPANSSIVRHTHSPKGRNRWRRACEIKILAYSSSLTALVIPLVSQIVKRFYVLLINKKI